MTSVDMPVNEAALTHMREAADRLRQEAERATAEADQITQALARQIAQQTQEQARLEEARRAVAALEASIAERAGWLIDQNKRAENARAAAAAAEAEAAYLEDLVARERARAAGPVDRLVASGGPADTAPMPQDGGETS